MEIKKTLDKAIKTIDESKAYKIEVYNDFEKLDMSNAIAKSASKFAKNVKVKKKNDLEYEIIADAENENKFKISIEANEAFKKWK